MRFFHFFIQKDQQSHPGVPSQNFNQRNISPHAANGFKNGLESQLVPSKWNPVNVYIITLDTIFY